ncbi:MAG: hypothetical protein ACREF3_18955 [Acetobacteraceae bacterium]
MTDLIPRFATIETWTALTGMPRRTVYDNLAAGHLKAIKCGRRTLIDVEHGLAWLRSQPAAVIRMSRRQAVQQQVAAE